MSGKMASAEKPSRKRKKLKNVEAIKKKVEGKLVVPETENASPPLPGFNLAGRPDFLKNRDVGLKKSQVKISGPYHTPDINSESYWHFARTGSRKRHPLHVPRSFRDGDQLHLSRRRHNQQCSRSNKFVCRQSAAAIRQVGENI